MTAPRRDPLRLLRSLRLTVVLLAAAGVYAAVAAVTPAGFRSPVFLAIVGAFMVNLAACTAHRLAYHPHRRLRDYMADGIHIGLLVLLLGGGGSLLARQEQPLVLTEGDQFGIGRRYELTLEETERTPDNWISRFAVIDQEDGTVEHAATRVNRPFRVGGYTVYQTAWERVPVLAMVYEDGRRYTMAAGEGFQAGEEIFVFERENGAFLLAWYRNDELVDRRPVAVGNEFGGLTVTGVEEVPRTVVTVVRDPGALIALIGAIIMSGSLLWYILDRALREDTPREDTPREETR